jgi:hypothetical protein
MPVLAVFFFPELVFLGFFVYLLFIYSYLDSQFTDLVTDLS